MKNTYTVSKLNSYIAALFANDFLLENVAVQGEVSNVKYHTSGHLYFTLKDEKSALSGMMFANNAMRLSFRLSEGMQVSVHGQVRVYERDGSYRLYADLMEKEGAGALYEKFLALREELSELGMFAPEYKRPIPEYPKTLGVVTARTGAAIRDIIQIAKRRDPAIQILLYPAQVQGDGAAKSIIRGIHALERRGVDVLIVGRGGGSIEDLWAFNDRELAQTVFDCAVPVISAVGHETDTTIIDYVADLRAPTPSAAAELAVGDKAALLHRLTEHRDTLHRLMRQRLTIKKSELQRQEALLKRFSPARSLDAHRTYLLSLEEGLRGAFHQKLGKRRHTLELLIERLRGLSPLNKLQSGYTYTEFQGAALRSVEAVKTNDLLRIYLTDGMVDAAVVGIEKKELFYGKGESTEGI